MTLALSLAIVLAFAQEPAADAPLTEEGAAALEEEMAESLAPADDPRVKTLVEWAEAADDPEAVLTMRFLVKKERSLPFQHGNITVGDGAVQLELGDDLVYLGPAETAVVLEDWGNPPGVETLGLIKPADGWLFGPDSWAVILGYEQDGWIDDAEAASIDYDDLLDSMKAGNVAQNEERARLGLATMHLKGWAEPPSYDPRARRLYWAKAFTGEEGEGTLNYDVRTLGRYGVLSMNAVAGLEMLDQVKRDMGGIRDVAHFTDGYRYEDYQPGVDRAAGYGLAALVAGGAGAAAMKGGFFKGLIAMLVAGKKFIIIGFVALLGMLKTLFGRGKSTEE